MIIIIIIIIIIGASLSEPHQVGETFALYTHVQCMYTLSHTVYMYMYMYMYMYVTKKSPYSTVIITQ